MSADGLPSVAVVGCGYWGKNLVRNFHNLRALAAVCDQDPGNLDRIKKEYPDTPRLTSYDKLIAQTDIRAIVLATPAALHASMARQALLAGKDLFVEKPLALSVEEARGLVALAREKGLILMVGHLLRYHPAFLKLQELADGGELGKIRYIYSNRLNFGKIRQEENVLWSFAPHDISMILGLLGETPSEVRVQGGNYLQQQVADVTVSFFSFPGGVKAHIFVSWLHPFKEQKLVVVGEKKMAVFDDTQAAEKLRLYSYAVTWENHAPHPSKSEAAVVAVDGTEPLYAECLHFLECVRSRRTPRTDGEEGLRVLTVLNRCQEELKNMKPQPDAHLHEKCLIHESAFVDPGVEIGEGTSIWHLCHILKGSRIGKNCKIGQNVVIGPNVRIGNRVKIQNNVSVYEGVTLEDDVFCGPSMVFTNVLNPRSEIPRMHELKPTLVKEGATLGANCTIVCGVIIGRYGFVGAGAVVTRDVPDYALVTGNPAKIKGWMCRCGVKLAWEGETAACVCGSRYRKTSQGIELVQDIHVKRHA